MSRLEGGTAVITGDATGIGAASAMRFIGARSSPTVASPKCNIAVLPRISTLVRPPRWRVQPFPQASDGAVREP